MAARKSGSDAFNNGPVSYLEEVPFKINEKFRCPAKVGLPVGFCLPDRSLLQTQYDFSLERRTVQWGVDLLEARARAEEASARREAEVCEASAHSEDTNPGCPGEDPNPPALNPVLASLSHDAILTPLPAPRLGPRGPAQPLCAPQLLDLTDFEREEDPFDKLELKTIDDKEELKSILQGQPQPYVCPAEVTYPGQGSRGSSPSPPSITTTPPSKGLTHKPNGLVTLLDTEKVSRDDRPCNIRSLTFPKLSDCEQQDPLPPSVKQRPLPTLTHNCSPQRTQRTEVILAPENSIKNGATKPMNPQCMSSGLPCGGALLSMTPSERRCVETLVGMGYSYEGVLRAMQKQGQNVEQVLDYLFVHGRLCERGFDSSAVEEVLEMYQCSEEKALQFLELMSRFGEMGFEREAIKEVLLVHNNDQDKALEDLMARAAAS